jgi:hypothetical protein
VHTACLFIAGALRAVIPSDHFTVAWTHSVEKTRWEERYVVEASDLRLTAARIQGSGAGMDPPADAIFNDGWWSWTPAVNRLPQLRLTLSPFTRDYDLCWRGRCHELHGLVAAAHASDAAPPGSSDIAVVDVRSCRERTP